MGGEKIAQLIVVAVVIVVLLVYMAGRFLRGRRAAKLPIRKHIRIPPDIVRNIVNGAIASVRGRVVRNDAASITFVTSLSRLSWRGQEMTVTITDNGDGSSDIEIYGRARPSLQIYDWDEASLIRKRMFEIIESRVNENATDD